MKSCPRLVGQNDVRNVRLVQGSHIVVPKKFDDPRAYFFQNKDGRIIFAIPYEGDFTLIGTTDRDYEGNPAAVSISGPEIDYLCEAASEYFAEPINRKDIVWTYSALRPLYDDGASKAQEATRDYVLKIDGPEGSAPVVNIFGGKITTYRRLSEAVLDKIGSLLGNRREPWTARTPLPGGDFPAEGFDAEVGKLKAGMLSSTCRTHAGLCSSMERGQIPCSASPSRMPISAESSAPTFTRPRFAIWSRTSGR